MDILSDLVYGFGVALQPPALLACFFGCLVGTLMGVLPGIGSVGAMSILFPLTFGLSPVNAIIMLAGIYYGSMYGGSTTSILVNIPGEAASVVTCLDGHQMALRGRAGAALGISAFGSFIGGTFGLIGLILIADPLASFAVKFGPAEYFALMAFALCIITYLTHGSLLRGLAMAGLGLFLSNIGQDIITGKARYTFGFFDLQEGLGIVPLVMGLFGISEVLINLSQMKAERKIFKTKLKELLPNKEEWRKSAVPIGRGTLLGFFLGILPGGGAIISSFVSYALEKRLSKDPSRFGKGAIEGVAGPETANNAATSGAFIPLFSLGIPSNVVMALLLGALMIHGIQPGPLILIQSPEIFWGTVASMYVGNILLLILNLPLIGIWVRVLKVRYTILFPLILLFCLVGAYSINGNIFDIFVMIFFGITGFFLRKTGYEPAPLVLAFILGPIFEQNLRQALILSDGRPAIFLTHPISATLLIISALLLLSSIRTRRKVLSEET